jgi:hypothetical protein
VLTPRPLRSLALALTIVAGLVPALASAGPAHLHGHHCGLYGQATEGPLTPVCRRDVPCDGPAGDARLIFLRGGRIVASTRTGATGSYRIALRPGHYSISSNIGMGTVEPSTTTVSRGEYSRLDFRLDTGIR